MRTLQQSYPPEPLPTCGILTRSPWLFQTGLRKTIEAETPLIYLARDCGFAPVEAPRALGYTDPPLSSAGPYRVVTLAGCVPGAQIAEKLLSAGYIPTTLRELFCHIKLLPELFGNYPTFLSLGSHRLEYPSVHPQIVWTETLKTIGFSEERKGMHQDCYFVLVTSRS